MIQPVFGWLSGKKRKEARARKKELAGELEAAAQLFVEAELPAEAARILLLKADAQTDPNKRMLLCAQAARIGEGSDYGQQAAKRKAMLSFDLVRANQGAPMQGELLRVAAELEQVGAWQAAVEAYRQAGDIDAEIRVLKDAGAIEQLEERLRQTSVAARKERDLSQLLRRIDDLDRIAERREALRSARAWLEREHDDQLQAEVDRISGRLVAGPTVALRLHGAQLEFVLGSELTLGRSGADIVVASSAISRQHLRIFRGPAATAGGQRGPAMVEDLDTRNGTCLAGARIREPLPIGNGIELELAGRVPCKLQPFDDSPDGPVMVLLAGERYVAPLGPLKIGDWQLIDAHDGDDRFIVLRTPEGREPPHMAGYRLGFQIELCVGDEITEGRGGEVVLEVPTPPRSSTA